MAMSSSLAVGVRVEGNDCAHNKDPSSLFTSIVRTMARASVDRVGCERNVVVGYVVHAIQQPVIDLLPLSVYEMLAVPDMEQR